MVSSLLYCPSSGLEFMADTEVSYFLWRYSGYMIDQDKKPFTFGVPT